MDTERRLEPKRQPMIRPMEVACLDTGTGYTGRSIDVSDRGIRAVLPHAPSTGSDVWIRFYYDEGDPVEAFGRIAWSKPRWPTSEVEVGFLLGAADAPRRPTATRRRPTRTTAYRCDDQVALGKTLAAVPTVALPVILRPGERWQAVYANRKTTCRVIDVGRLDTNGYLQVTVCVEDRALRPAPDTPSDVAASTRTASMNTAHIDALLAQADASTADHRDDASAGVHNTGRVGLWVAHGRDLWRGAQRLWVLASWWVAAQRRRLGPRKNRRISPKPADKRIKNA